MSVCVYIHLITQKYFMIHSKLFTSGIHVLYLYKIIFLGMVIDFICSEAFKQKYVPSIFVKSLSLIVFCLILISILNYVLSMVGVFFNVFILYVCVECTCKSSGI